MRGEYFFQLRKPRHIPGSPPLARGIPGVQKEKGGAERITPACAGNTKTELHKHWVRQDHPRLRGEYSLLSAACSFVWGSPPLARGIPRHDFIINALVGITPACAGNTDLRERISTVYKDHPRLRGEYVSTRPCQTVDRGSPPLARGILLSTAAFYDYYRITPACAGNTYLFNYSAIIPEDHPRLRGEYADKFFKDLSTLGSPPLARGIRSNTKQNGDTSGITPACAGNTFLMILYPNTSRDHPRLRGEYSTS